MCTAEQICSAASEEIYYKVDKNYEYYFDNWYVQMNLMCIPEFQIGLLVTFYFIGYAVGALAFALPDQIGRKRSCIYGFIMCLVSETTMLLVPNYYVRLIGFFCIGAS